MESAYWSPVCASERLQWSVMHPARALNVKKEVVSKCLHSIRGRETTGRREGAVALTYRTKSAWLLQ